METRRWWYISAHTVVTCTFSHLWATQSFHRDKTTYVQWNAGFKYLTHSRKIPRFSVAETSAIQKKTTFYLVSHLSNLLQIDLLSIVTTSKCKNCLPSLPNLFDSFVCFVGIFRNPCYISGKCRKFCKSPGFISSTSNESCYWFLIENSCLYRP